MATVRMLTPYQLNDQLEKILNEVKISAAKQLEKYAGELAPANASNAMRRLSSDWIQTFQQEIKFLQGHLWSLKERSLLEKKRPKLIKKLNEINNLKESFEACKIIKTMEENIYRSKKELKPALKKTYELIKTTIDRSLEQQIKSVVNSLQTNISTILKRKYDAWKTAPEVLGDEGAELYLQANEKMLDIAKEWHWVNKELKKSTLNQEQVKPLLEKKQEIIRLQERVGRVLSEASGWIIQNNPPIAAMLTRLTYPDEQIEAPLDSLFGPFMRPFIIIYTSLYGEKRVQEFFKKMGDKFHDEYINVKEEKITVSSRSRLSFFNQKFFSSGCFFGNEKFSPSPHPKSR